jgi:hypothetical protein
VAWHGTDRPIRKTSAALDLRAFCVFDFDFFIASRKGLMSHAS